MAAFIQLTHPALFASALAAALIPIIIHLINRRRHRRVPWAAMSFLLAAVQRSARRVRFEQTLLLLLRVGAILILGAIVGRPYFQRGSLAALGGTRVHRIVIVDNSGSMNAVADPTSRRTHAEQARRIADRLLDGFPEGDGVSLITAAAPAQELVGYECFDRRMARNQIDAIRPSARGTDLGGAFRSARRLVEESSAAIGSRVVYLISDQCRSAWQPPLSDTSAPAGSAGAVAGSTDTVVEIVQRLAQDAEVVLIQTAYKSQSNLAVSSVTPKASLPARSTPIQFEAKITNHGDRTVRELALQIRREEQILRRIPLDALEPEGRTSVPFTLVLEEAGQQGVQVRVEGEAADGLPEDDVGYLSVEVLDDIPVLIVDGRPGSTALEGQSGYLKTAWSPLGDPSEPSLFSIKVISESELPGEALGGYSLITLCGVSRLEESVWQSLEDYIKQGGAALVFTGEGVSQENYNRFAYRDGLGWMPGRLGTVRVGAESGDSAFRLLPEPFTHAITSDFAETDESGLFTARISRYHAVDPATVQSEVVMRYGTNDPALLVREFGRGRCALFTTTANMDWNNLPAKGDFVSLMMNLAGYLCPAGGLRRTVVVGEAIRESLSPAQVAQPAQITTPSGTHHAPRLVCEQEDCALLYEETEDPGLYRLSIGNELSTFAVNYPPQESDLRQWSSTEAEAALAEVRWVDDDDASLSELAAPSGDPAPFLAHLLLGLLLLESFIAMRAGEQR